MGGGLSNIFNINQFQIRINSDFISISEFFNFYFLNSKDNINLYIKQYYGFSELYEYEDDLISLSDLSNLTKPIKNSNNLESAFTKMIDFKNDKLLTGYLGSNSYFDIYFEVDNNSTIIELSEIMKQTYKCAAKYLKKNIEYSLNFTADHLVKLEYGENVEISIFDENKKIIATLTKDNIIAKIQGDNIKIKSNNNALLYFYGKNMSNQIEIGTNQLGKNIEITVSGLLIYSIDFGFSGYNPLEIMTYSYNYLENGGTIYLENPYDRLKIQLAKEEKLFFNYNSNGNPEIKYVPNINHKNNDYTFNYIQKNSTDKTLVINNIRKEKIRYQVNFCGSPHTIKIYFKGAKSTEEELLEFNNSKKVIDYNINKYPHRLRFDSEKDFVFSYSFIDSADLLINDYKKWNKERKELTNLIIENITKKYPDNSDIFTIKFKPNYKNSTTRYIIIIGSNNTQNTIQNLNNPCYITKLANEKPKGIKIVNVIDVGENDIIEEDIDIYDILGETDKYIVNIISQELRFEKKLNYYNAMIFTHRKSYKKEEDNNNEKKGLNSTYIVLISVFGIIIVLIGLFFILKKKKKKSQNSDFNDKTKEISNEQLLQDI